MSLQRPSTKPISTRAIVLGAVIVAVVGIGATLLLLIFLGEGDPASRARLEVIRVASTIVVGTGGGVALYLAARRQQSTEIALAYQAETLQVQREANEATEREAEERRLAELYAQSAEQLGSDTAAVRLAGLYALERLAQANSEYRTVVIDVVCAYLRMPFELPDSIPAVGPPTLATRRSGAPSVSLVPYDPTGTSDPDPIQARRREELEVRKAFQTVLYRHCLPNLSEKGKNKGFWGLGDDPVYIDLSGALLHQFSMPNTRIAAKFDGAIFNGNTVFEGTLFVGRVSFRDAHFRGLAWFSDAQIAGRAVFTDARFEWSAMFLRTTFGEMALLDGASFVGTAVFDATTFIGDASFSRAAFSKANFSRSKFLTTASLAGALISSANADRCILPGGWKVDSLGQIEDGVSEPMRAIIEA